MEAKERSMWPDVYKESVVWIETSRKVYFSIYYYHQDKLKAFASFTDMDGSFPTSTPGIFRQMTAWGFAEADCPIIASTAEGDEWKYFIACARDGRT